MTGLSVYQKPKLYFTGGSESLSDFRTLQQELHDYMLLASPRLDPESYTDMKAAIPDSRLVIILTGKRLTAQKHIRAELQIANRHDVPVVIAQYQDARSTLPRYLQNYEVLSANSSTSELASDITRFVSDLPYANRERVNSDGKWSVSSLRFIAVISGILLGLILQKVVIDEQLLPLREELFDIVQLSTPVESVATAASTTENTATATLAFSPTTTSVAVTSTSVPLTSTSFSPSLLTPLPSAIPSIDINALMNAPPPGTNQAWQPVEHVINGNPVVYVPEGCFQQGASESLIEHMCDPVDEACYRQFRDEMPQHTVCLNSFFIDKYEVSELRYEDSISQYPMTSVSWKDAIQFCEQKSGYLVTEAQWEYAARGMDAWSYTTGDSYTPDQIILNQNNPVNVETNTGDVSWVGVYHLNGNVREWVFDDYSHDFYLQVKEINPVASNENPFRVVRGASWNTANPVEARLSNRHDEFVDNELIDVGFRCAYPPIVLSSQE